MHDWERWVREYLDLPAMTGRRDLRAVAELAAHVEETWREARTRGATEEEADTLARATLSDRAKAVRDLLDAERHHLAAEAARSVERAEEGLRQRGRRWIPAADLLRDLRLSVRTLARRPMFAAAVIFVLAIGIGATTAIFTLVDAVILSPLPFPDADRLVVVSHSSPRLKGGDIGTCAAWHLTYRDENRVFDELGMYSPPGGGTAAITGSGEPESVPVIAATSGVFRATGMSAVVGRLFAPGDDEPGAPQVVLLGRGYWLTRFGGDRSVIGKTLRVDDVDSTIVGVLPSTLRVLGPEPSVVMSLRIRRAGLFVGNVGYVGIARLKRGVTRERAVSDMARMLPMALEKFPGGPTFEANKQAGYVPAATPLKDRLVGNAARLLWALMASTVIVLLIACANVANLFLTRAESRDREMAVRAALGASGARVAWEHVRECVVLSVLGGLVGLGLAWTGLRALVGIAPPQLPWLADVSLGSRAFLFAAGVSAMVAIFVAVFPVLRRHGRRVVDALKQGGLATGLGRGRRRMLHALASAQIALALVLLIVLGLVVRSGLALRQVDPGLTHVKDVLAFQVEVRAQIPRDASAVLSQAQAGQLSRSDPRVEAAARARAQAQNEAALAQEAIATRLRDVAGVRAVGMGTSLPMHVGANINPLYVDGVTIPGKTPPMTRRHKWIGEGYFESLGIPLLEGRSFTWQDVHNRIAAVVVSESLARTYWGSVGAAIGKRVSIRPDPVRWYEVIGVARDVREDGLSVDPVPMVYWPQVTLATWQGNAADEMRVWSNVSYAVRSDRVGTPGFLRDVQKAVWSVNQNLPLDAAGPLSAFVAASWASTSFTLLLLGIAGAVALVLGLVGVYGVVSYGVSRRTRELGMRMALGAQAGSVERMVLRQAVVVVAIGAAVGLGLAVWVTRAMSSLLFGVSATDPATFAAVSLLLAAVALAASYLPARRAAHVEPMVVLRAE